jgi:RNA polymerase sigma factor (sigma-70 family)
MATRPTKAVFHEIRTLFAVGAIGGLSDSQLMDCFLSGRGRGEEAEAAFAALVGRHGPMVMGVCRRLLADPNDADDAFQATFLVLVRRAHSIARRDLLGNWLYGVAYRTARVARSRAARRRAKERQVIDMFQTGSSWGETDLGDLPTLLDEELSRLPEKFRLPVVLCELEGQSRKEVARRLGIPEGTLSSRLARARELLRGRLEKRGLALGAGTVAAALSRDTSAALVRPALVDSTVQAALHYAAGGAVSGSAAALAERTLKVIFLTKLKTSAVTLLAAFAVASLAAVAVAQVRAAWDKPPSVAVPGATPPSSARPRPRPLPDVVAAKQEKSAAAWGDGIVETRGRVLGPDGKPMAGAELTLWWYQIVPVAWHHHDFPTARPKLVATTGPDGTFKATFPKSVVANAFSTTQIQNPWKWMAITAAAEGYGPAWGSIHDETNNYELKLVEDDVPVRGRILDLQGRPVSGVSV